jgi:hypothetical protein
MNQSESFGRMNHYFLPCKAAQKNLGIFVFYSASLIICMVWLALSLIINQQLPIFTCLAGLTIGTLDSLLGLLSPLPH